MTRKITRAVARIRNGLQDCLYLGNLDAVRDWGYAPEFVEGMWLMLQQDEPDDYVLATGVKTSVRDFAAMAFEYAGLPIHWEGEGTDERGVSADDGRVMVAIDPLYYRPAEVDLLVGDASKAREKLGWEARTGVRELVRIMVDHDLGMVERLVALRSAGYNVIEQGVDYDYPPEFKWSR